ncbi:unnamed protein product [[Candida] boidinii]|uniref:Unnamed protein product n=1 Tax=Candida boidinii TaxID=5477 RepID=A0ACB5TGN6_CANBO|nr:unnamed protein product [[Candida] boidinii]
MEDTCFLNSSEKSQEQTGVNVQIIAYDSYQSLPTPLDKRYFTINGKRITKNDKTDKFNHVPVIRVYGKIPTGHTCLLHIHNIFPYLYIPYKGPITYDSEEIDKYLLELKTQIDIKLKYSFQNGGRKKTDDSRRARSAARGRGSGRGGTTRNERDSTNETEQDNNNAENSNDEEMTDGENSDDQAEEARMMEILSKSGNNFVADLSVVRGVYFYGFSEGYSGFVKVSMLSPKYITRLTRLLHDKKINNQFNQPYESHIPYMLQFLSDYNAYGSDWLKLSQCFLRYPLVSLKENEEYQTEFQTDFSYHNKLKINQELKDYFENKFINRDINRVLILNKDKFPRIGRTMIEIDTCSTWITNRNELVQRDIHQDFLEFKINSLQDNVDMSKDSGNRYLSSIKGLLKDVNFQRSQRKLPNDPKLKLFEEIERTFKSVNWIDQTELDSLLDYCSELSLKLWQEKNPKSSTPTIESLTKKHSFLDMFDTAFESVKSLNITPNILNEHLLHNNIHDTDDCSLLIDTIIKEDLSSPTLSEQSDTFQSSQILANLQSQEYLQSIEENEDHNPNNLQGDDNDNENELPLSDNSSSSSEDDTDDDMDEFLGSIPHLDASFSGDIADKETSQISPGDADAIPGLSELAKQTRTLSKQELNSKLIPSNSFELQTSTTDTDTSSHKKVSNSETVHDSENSDLKIFALTQKGHLQNSLILNESKLHISDSFSNISGNATTDVSINIGKRNSPYDNVNSASQHSNISSQNISVISPSLSSLNNVKFSNKRKCIPQFTKDELDLYEYPLTAPYASSKEKFMETFEDYNTIRYDYQDPYYSRRDNFDSKPFIFAGKKFSLECLDILGLSPYTSDNNTSINSSNFLEKFKSRKKRKEHKESIWTYTHEPPSFDTVQNWTNLDINERKRKSQIMKSQINFVTPRLKGGFKYPSLATPVNRRKTSHLKLSILIIEIHVNTRGVLFPDPKKDEISMIFWRFDKTNNLTDDLNECGILIKDDPMNIKHWQSTTNSPVACFQNEMDMIKELINLVEYLDPDILGGYEIHSKSWGYILERFRKLFNIDLATRFSRVISQFRNKASDRWGYTHASGIKITGRHLLNIWRPLRSGLNLLRYSLENVTFHTIHERLPFFGNQILTQWYTSKDIKYRSALLSYYTKRVEIEMKIIDNQELIERTTEQSRLLGIDYYSIFYRGSQFKVESLLVRLAKAENYILISPSKKQVFKQDPLQCIPLILEPESMYYKSPLVVLDFQSLYPSIVIAHNYCYSTLLGRLRGFDPKKFQRIGITSLKLPPGLLNFFREYITISPNGLIFLKKKIRESLLAKFLIELLDARILVKGTMNKLKDDQELNKLYNNRQLALKLIANVTYGYTSATFSGRMPCSDIADAIVSTGRETLLKAIAEIENNNEWGAKVIYGDTDSLFVYLPGKSKDEAMELGQIMAKHVSSLNPAPMKLKFEKVYFPSILLSKKRYVGYAYEYKDQKEAKLDAKGIETIRRDGIPAQQKIVEKCIRILFDTNDLSQVRDYVENQFIKIMKGKVSIQDFCFGKEVRLGTYKSAQSAPPGAQISMAKMKLDRRSEPQYRERVAYLVVKGYKGQILRDRCMSPNDFLARQDDEKLELDWEYYITKVLIPPLERLFSLLGADVRAWYREMPKIFNTFEVPFQDANKKNQHSPEKGNRGSKSNNNKNNNASLLDFVTSALCYSCGELVNDKRLKLCDICRSRELETLLNLKIDIHQLERAFCDILMVCRECTQKNLANNAISSVTCDSCQSEDCPVYYSRLRTKKKLLINTQKYEELLDW